MSNKKENGGVWLATLERFGYTLTAVGKTDRQASQAVLRAYEEAYENENGESPRDVSSYGFETDYDIAVDEVDVRFMEYGKVEWD